MIVDAIVLAGGRSSRLGAVSKAELVVDGFTLLQRTLAAAGSARRIVVVGPVPGTSLPAGVLLTREEPCFGGPVAGIAAGMTTLRDSSDATGDAVLVLACDMPYIDRAIQLLIKQFVESPEPDCAIAVDAAGRLQPLAAIYRTGRLAAALADRGDESGPVGTPVFSLLDSLQLKPVEVPPDATSDVDSWDDAIRLGAHPQD